jgi:hypothetical protein
MLLLLISTAAGAATLESKEAARKLTDQVMAKVGGGEIEAGLLLLKPYAVIPDAQFSVMVDNVKLQLPVMQQRFGKVIGSEFILERSAGESLLKIVQIQKFEKHAMRWNFLFYSADGKWVLNACTFDDKLQSVFDE